MYKQLAGLPGGRVTPGTLPKAPPRGVRGAAEMAGEPAWTRRPGTAQGEEVRAKPSRGAPPSGLPEGPARPGSPGSEPLDCDPLPSRPRPPSAPSGFRVPAEGGGGGASRLPAGPGEEKGSPCRRGSPAAHLASRSQPLPAPLPAPSRLPPPSGGAKFLGAGTRSLQGCASRGRRREGHSLYSFPPTCCPGPFQGGGGGCAGRAAAPRRAERGGECGAPQAPRTTLLLLERCLVGGVTAGPRDTETVVCLAWVLAEPRLAVHQAHGALCVSPQAPLLPSLSPPRLHCPLSAGMPPGTPPGPKDGSGSHPSSPSPPPLPPTPSAPRPRRAVPAGLAAPLPRSFSADAGTC
uniref:basic salivary proline-rich protein 1-like n=1 Tax=Odobenus rosmarus divergens TaxID=9708 RepID=UPI00063C71CB|nr:PREDICTED: basic salivary proline-rich protein 1-like [Odobenus rosmarus divergens]